MTKQYPLAYILSITSDRLLCPMEGVYDILNHITGDNLFTHALPRAGKYAKPILLEQYPELAAAGTEEAMNSLDTNIAIAKQHGGEREKIGEAIATWLGEMKEKHGLKDAYNVASYEQAWLSLDPMEELVSMIGNNKIVTVAAP